MIGFVIYRVYRHTGLSGVGTLYVFNGSDPLPLRSEHNLNELCSLSPPKGQNNELFLGDFIQYMKYTRAAIVVEAVGNIAKQSKSVIISSFPLGWSEQWGDPVQNCIQKLSGEVSPSTKLTNGRCRWGSIHSDSRAI